MFWFSHSNSHRANPFRYMRWWHSCGRGGGLHFAKPFHTRNSSHANLDFGFLQLGWIFASWFAFSEVVSQVSPLLEVVSLKKKFLQVVSPPVKIGLGCAKCHSCAMRVFRTVRKFSHLDSHSTKFSHLDLHCAKFSFSSMQFSCNDHNFFVSTPIWTPFEVLDFWLPKLQNGI